MKPLSEARVALVFEWFQKFGGVERVIAEMLDTFPNAELYALVHDPEDLKGTPLDGMRVHTSFIQRLPWAKEKYRSYLPLMPLAVEQLDLRTYDLVLSSSHTVAKGVLTRADQLHVSYTHTPVRYAWDLYHDYLEASGLDNGVKGGIARLILHYLRLWDLSAANRVDAYLANSDYVGRRIGKLYRREAQTVYPPVDVERYRHDLSREKFFVVVSRLVPYKRLDLIVEAFSEMGKPLIVLGDGPERKRLQLQAASNVEFLGYQPDDVIVDHLQRARAFIFAANEDFGIAPVEAQAAGCPVIAFRKGGSLETVVGWPDPGATGVFFDAQTSEALKAAVGFFEANADDFDAEACRRNAVRFSRDAFRRKFRAIVEELWDEFQKDENRNFPRRTMNE